MDTHLEINATVNILTIDGILVIRYTDNMLFNAFLDV